MERKNDKLFELGEMDDSCSSVKLGRHGTVLGLLYDAYTEHNNAETHDIQQALKELYGLLDHATGVDTEEIINAVCDLCREHEKVGFINGIQIGIRLAQESNIR